MALELRRARRGTLTAVLGADSAIVGDALATWLVTRLAIALTAVFAAVLAGYLLNRSLSPLWSWDQWDTHWYLIISRAGYREPATANFFPLYPSLVGALAAAAGDAGGPVWPARDGLRLGAALLVSAAFSALAFVGVALAAARTGGGAAGARFAVRAAAAYPFAFFLAAGYSDACFLALAVFALLLSRGGSWLPAIACAVLAGLARPTALALVAPLVIEAVGQAGGWRSRRALALGIAAGVAPLAGMAAFAMMLWARFGDPLLAARTQHEIWHHQLMAPWSTASLILNHLRPGHGGLLPLDLGLVLIGAGLLWAGRRLVPGSWSVYTAGLIVLIVAAPVPAQNDVLASAGRYLLAAFPLFVILGRLVAARPWLETGVAAGGYMLQAGLLMTFLVGGPVL